MSDREECVVTYTTNKLGYRVLGKIEIERTCFTWLDARDKVIELITANGVNPADILPVTGTWTTIELRGGSVVTISPLPAFEKYAGCVAAYMD